MFAAADLAGKRNILTHLLSNCSYRDGKVSASYRRPFDIIMEKLPREELAAEASGSRMPKTAKWLAGVDENANFDLPIPLIHIQEPAVKVRKRDRLRADRIAAAGGPLPTLRERAVMLAEKLGEARTRELTEIGIPRCYLTRMCEEGLLIKTGYGRYRAAQRRAA
jgi:hypothetical protein